MLTFKNARFTKRDHECTNVVACQAAVKPPEGYWEAVPDADVPPLLEKLTQLYIQAGVTYWGYL